jgi:hypothetical protein
MCVQTAGLGSSSPSANVAFSCYPLDSPCDGAIVGIIYISLWPKTSAQSKPLWSGWQLTQISLSFSWIHRLFLIREGWGEIQTTISFLLLLLLFFLLPLLLLFLLLDLPPSPIPPLSYSILLLSFNSPPPSYTALNKIYLCFLQKEDSHFLIPQHSHKTRHQDSNPVPTFTSEIFSVFCNDIGDTSEGSEGHFKTFLPEKDHRSCTTFIPSSWIPMQVA